jgi:YD repeat-containing protein
MPLLPSRCIACCIVLSALAALPAQDAAAQAGQPSCGPSLAGSPCADVQVAGLDATGGAPQGVGNPVNLITGNKYQRETDMAPLPGLLGLELVRHYNSRHAAPGMSLQGLGHGWTLSYDTRLYAAGASLQVVQADGARIIFARSALSQTLCTSRDPGHGLVRIVKVGRDRLYRWLWPDGRELRFDINGFLTGIVDAGGAQLVIERYADGRILQVTDPQGRRMTFNYLAPAQYRSGAYPGVQSIDTPVGRFIYDYDKGKPPHNARLGAVHLPTRYDPAGQAPRKLGEPRTTNSVSAIRRLYHYEDARFPTLLTGISVDGAGNDGRAMHERIATWAYDGNGLAVMSVRGQALKTGADGKPVAGTGIEQLRFDRSEPGRTRVVNSLGQVTVYRHAIVAGAFRVLEARGAGCAHCGPVNVRYAWDKSGWLAEATWLDSAGVPVQGWRQKLDRLGRQYALHRVDYAGGREAGQTLLLNRTYPFPSQVRSLPGAMAPRGHFGPNRIATDSALAGQRHATVIEYSPQAQPVRISETGYNPADGSQMVRVTRYRYEEIRGRSMLVEVDGPLPNGPLGTPADSDITRYQWNSRAEMLLSVTAPGGLVTRFDYGDDSIPGSRRLAAVTGSDGSVTRYRYDLAFLGQPTAIERDGRSVSLDYDALGRLRRIADLPAVPGRSAQFDYDSANRLVAISDAQGYRQQLGLDSEGGLRMAALYAPGQAAPLRAA